MDPRDQFLQAVRRALNWPVRAKPDFPPETAYSQDSKAVEARAPAVAELMAARADELLARLQDSAAQAGWKVARKKSPSEAAAYIAGLARDLEARLVLRSAHPVLDRLRLDASLTGAGIRLEAMALKTAPGKSGRGDERRALRQQAARADMGVTGVDFAIAETGSCVIIARKGVSRLVSLLPPVHVAVVERGQVLPSLDELFTLRRRDSLHDDQGSYLNILTGPSRSADIEYTLVTGVHGPGEVHLVLVG